MKDVRPANAAKLAALRRRGKNADVAHAAELYRKAEQTRAPILDIIQPRRRNKYGVAPKERRTSKDGRVFASLKEFDRFVSLCMLREIGAVRFFLCQVPFHLPGGTKYVVDFVVFWNPGHQDKGAEVVTFEDVKGHRTREYLTKKKIVEALYPVTITEI